MKNIPYRCECGCGKLVSSVSSYGHGYHHAKPRRHHYKVDCGRLRGTALMEALLRAGFDGWIVGPRDRYVHVDGDDTLPGWLRDARLPYSVEQIELLCAYCQCDRPDRCLCRDADGRHCRDPRYVDSRIDRPAREAIADTQACQ